MNAEYRGNRDGCRDGEFDATQSHPRKPRPKFMEALLSDRYRTGYMASYKDAYDYWLRQAERSIARELVENSKLITGDQVPKDKVFERGWRDGFAGKDTLPKGLSHEEIKTFERGHRSGHQHREWDLANRLREKSRNQHCR